MTNNSDAQPATGASTYKRVAQRVEESMIVKRYRAIRWVGCAYLALWLIPMLFGELDTNATPSGVLSLQFAKTGGIAHIMMDVWGPEGQRAAFANLLCDFVYIGTYSVLFSGWILWIANRVRDESPILARVGRRLGFGQFVAAACDLIENVLLLWGLCEYSPTGEVSDGIFAWAARFATAKFVLILLGSGYFAYTLSSLTEVRRYFLVVWHMRFSLVMAFAVPTILIVSAQAQETLRVLAENLRETPSLAICFVVAVAFFSWMAWYWARFVGFQVAPSEPEETLSLGQKSGLRWLPIVCLLTPIALSAVAVYEAAQPVAAAESLGAKRGEGESKRIELKEQPSSQRALTHSPARSKAARTLYLTMWVFIAMGFAAWKFLAKERRREIFVAGLTFKGLWAHEPKPRLFYLLLTFIPGVALFVAVGFLGSAGVLWTRVLGTPAVLLLATAALIPIGSTLVVICHSTRVPWMLFGFCAALVFSLFDLNDNHEVRRIGHQPPPVRDIYPSLQLETSFPKWLQSRPDFKEFVKADAEGNSIEGEYPVFFVAAEGGGIRAAYQTGMLLATLQDADPRFVDHVFCISGVSGGSVGAGVFGALAADGEKAHHADWRRKTDAVLSRDLLTPLIAASLSPDLLQRFIGCPIPRFDRARALEYAIEGAWREGVQNGNNHFARSFYNFCDRFEERSVPALFLNTTGVRTGERMVVSTHFSLSSQWSEPPGPERLPTQSEFDIGTSTIAEKLYGQAQSDIALSTAVTLSSRFPYLTPSGFIAIETPTSGSHPIPQRIKHRYVDGGYFDNSGLVTIGDVIAALQESVETKHWRPVVLRIGFGGRATLDQAIQEQARRLQRSSKFEKPRAEVVASQLKSSNPDLQRAVEAAERIQVGASAPLSPAPGPGLDELLTPLQTFLATWDGHNRTEYRRLKSRLWDQSERIVKTSSPDPKTQPGRLVGSRIPKLELIEFAFFEFDTPLPLGWQLSRAARDDLQWQVAGFDPENHPIESNDLKSQLEILEFAERAADDSSSNLASLLTVLRAIESLRP